MGSGERSSGSESEWNQVPEDATPSRNGLDAPFVVLALISFGFFVLSNLDLSPLATFQLQPFWGACLVLLALISLDIRRRRAHRKEESRFWSRLVLAMGFWLMAEVCAAFVPAQDMPLALSLWVDACYVLYYYLWILAINRLPHQRDPRGLSGPFDRLLFWPANAVFTFGFFTYFVLIPAAWNRQIYVSVAPYNYAYILLDTYIVVSLLVGAHSVDSVKWRTLYRLIGGAFVLSLAGDVLAVLHYALGWKLLVQSEHFYRLMLLSLVVCLDGWGKRHALLQDETTETKVEEIPELHWYTLVAALLPAWIHFLLYTLGWLDPTSKGPREAMLLVWTFLIGGVALLQHRALDRARRRLRVGHEVLSEELAGEKKAHSDQAKLINELEAKNSEMERFTYTISHDLKSPLVTIQGFIGMLERDLVRGDEVRMGKDLQRIRYAANTMQTLLEDLLELSRIGRVVNPSQWIPLGDLVDEVLETARGRLDGINVRVDLPQESTIVWGDRPRLFEVFLNLIENAARHRGEGKDPWIEIGLVGAPSGSPAVPVRIPEEIEAGRSGKMVYVRDNGGRHRSGLPREGLWSL